MVISNTDAIFDSNPNTAESLGPSFTIRDIDTTGAGVSMGGEVKKADKYIRFHGNAVACFENIAPGVPRTVMDIQSNVMPEMVGEQDVHCLALRIYQHCHVERTILVHVRFQIHRIQAAAIDLSVRPLQCYVVGPEIGLRSLCRAIDKCDVRSTLRCISPAADQRICH